MYGMPRRARQPRHDPAPRRAAALARARWSSISRSARTATGSLRTLDGAELYQDGEAAPIANSIGAVTERVTRLLGMTPRRVLQHLLHRPEGTRRHGGDDGRRAGAVPLARARLRAPAARAGRAAHASAAAHCGPGSRRSQAGLVPIARALEAVARSRPSAWPRPSRARRRRPRRCAGATAHARERAPASWAALQRRRDRAGALETDLRLAEQAVHGRAEAEQRLSGEVTAAESARDPPRGARGRCSSRCRRCARRWRRSRATPRATRGARKLAAQREELVAATGPRWPRRLAAAPEPGTFRGGREERLAAVREALEPRRRQSSARRTQWVQDAQEAKTKRRGPARPVPGAARSSASASWPREPDGACPTVRAPAGQRVRRGARRARPADGGGDAERQLLSPARRPAEGAAARGERLDAAARAERQAEVQRAPGRRPALAARAARGASAGAQQDRELGAAPRRRWSRTSPRCPARSTTRRATAACRPSWRDSSRSRSRPSGSVSWPARVRRCLGQLAAARSGARGRVGARRRRCRRSSGALGFSEERSARLERRVDAAEQAAGRGASALVRGAGRAAAPRGRPQAARRRASSSASAREREAGAVALDLRAQPGTRPRAGRPAHRAERDAPAGPVASSRRGFLRDLTNGRYTELELDEDYVATLRGRGRAQAR